MEWKLAEAKNKFSELVTRALLEGPQRVQRRSDAVVVVSEKEYAALTGKRPSFKAFMCKRGPNLEGVELSRDPAPMRVADL